MAVVDTERWRRIFWTSRRSTPLVAEELQNWRKKSLYSSENDYVFPSTMKNGTQPLQPEMILRRHIRPALERLHIAEKIGWHSFRHGLATLLRQNGTDVKTAQELLRHANSRITLEIYQQSVPEERRAAQASAFRILVGGLENRTTKHQDFEEKEEVVFGTA